MVSPNPRFTPDAITFLRALKRNNDREWFKARKARYDVVLRGPMIALIDRLAGDFRTFAPELVASPRTSLYRIYRDTRFSGDKAPLKTHIAAVFPCRGLAKHQGAGLYVEIAPGGGLGRWRSVLPGHLPAARRARAHRVEHAALPGDRRVASVSRQCWPASRRAAATRAPRFSERP